MIDVSVVEITRRRALFWLATGSLAGLFPTTLACAPEESSSLDRPEAADAIAVPEAILQLGREYLEQTPDEARRRDLLALLPSELADPAADLSGPLAERVREDFEHNRVVLLRGWLLARTELRVAALVALMEPGPGA
jgi:hypothetical protein